MDGESTSQEEEPETPPNSPSTVLREAKERRQWRWSKPRRDSDKSEPASYLGQHHEHAPPSSSSFSYSSSKHHRHPICSSSEKRPSSTPEVVVPPSSSSPEPSSSMYSCYHAHWCTASTPSTPSPVLSPNPPSPSASCASSGCSGCDEGERCRRRRKSSSRSRRRAESCDDCPEAPEDCGCRLPNPGTPEYPTNHTCLPATSDLRIVGFTVPDNITFCLYLCHALCSCVHSLTLCKGHSSLFLYPLTPLLTDPFFWL